MDLTTARQAEHAKYVRAYQQPRYRMKAARRVEAAE